MSFNTDSPSWLWTDSDDNLNQYSQFIHKFYLENKNQNIKLNISSDSQYVAWINGKLVAFGQFADYPQYKVYDSIDITEYLEQGANTLCILGYYQGEDSATYRKEKAGIVFEICSSNDIITASCSETICRLATDYISGDMEKFSPQLSFSFKYDASKNDGWNLCGYKPDQTWLQAYVYKNSLQLYLRPVEKTTLEERAKTLISSQGVFKDNCLPESSMGQRMQSAFLSFCECGKMSGRAAPISLPDEKGVVFKSDYGDGIYLLIDIGFEESGYINIELDAPAGTLINIGFGEHLDDLRVRSGVGGRDFAADYFCKGGHEVFTHLIKRVGCRYLQLNIHSNEATIYYAGILPSHYPVKYRGSFKSSDALSQKIYDTSVRTLLLCMHEHYEDCPWREQALYSMDSRNQMLSGYYCFGEYDFAKASIRLLALGLREDGLLELCAPARVVITIPSFSLSWIIQLYEYVLYSGDLEFAVEMYPVSKKIIDAFINRITEEGLITCFHETPYWNFYEWETGLYGESIIRSGEIVRTYDAPLNAFFSSALNAMAKLCGYLNKSDLCNQYEILQGSLNGKIAEMFWDTGKQAFCTFIDHGEKKHFCELTQSLIVYCGACPNEKIEKVLDLLVKQNNELIPVTLGYSIFKYEALLVMPEKYSQIVFDEILKVWGDMLFKGATSFWETQKGTWDFNNAGSLCHGWSAVPVYLYHNYVLGLKPKALGFSSYISSPVLSGIFQASGHVPSADGGYDVLVKRINDVCESIVRKI